MSSAPPAVPPDPDRLDLLRDLEQRPLLVWRLLLAGTLLVAGRLAPVGPLGLLTGATGTLLLLAGGVIPRLRDGRLRSGALLAAASEGGALLLLSALAPLRLPVLLLWAIMALRALPLRLWGRAMGRLGWLVPAAALLLPALGAPLTTSESLMVALALATLVGVALAIGAASEQSISDRRSLAQRLVQRESDLGVRTQVLTATATNLATRVLELRSLQEGMKAINASLALDALLAGTVHNVAQLFGGTACAIGLREGGALRIAAQSSEPPLLADVLPLAEQATRLGEAAHATVVAPDEGGQLPALAVPLIVEGEAIGALVACRSVELPFTSDDQERLTTFADQAALAVNNSRLYERVASLYREVKERSEELEAVLNSIGDAVVVTDSAGNIQLTNPVAADLLGLPDRPLPRTPLPPELLQSGFAEQLRHALTERSEAAVLGELTIQHSGAMQLQRNYQALSAPLRGSEGEGQARGVVTVLRDVTASKELEQLKQNFVGTISHELKTPLHTIKGFLNIVLAERSSGTLTEVQRDFLRTASEQTRRLERLILDLLEFNRLESGQIKLNPTRLDVALLAHEATEQFRAVAHEAQVTLACEMDGPMVAEGDRLRVEQVLHNLIGNALKFTPAGGRVTVRGVLLDEAVQFGVEDTGIGIPPEAQERIFERFFQVESAQDRRYGGTGLGLAICKHIVERHGGRIWVESAVGQGSTFFVWLPREQGTGRALTVDFSRLEATGPSL